MVAFFFFNRFFTHSQYLYTASGEKTISAPKYGSPFHLAFCCEASFFRFFGVFFTNATKYNRNS